MGDVEVSLFTALSSEVLDEELFTVFSVFVLLNEEDVVLFSGIDEVCSSVDASVLLSVTATSDSEVVILLTGTRSPFKYATTKASLYPSDLISSFALSALAKLLNLPAWYLVIPSLFFSAVIGLNPLKRSCGIGFLKAPTCTL